MTWMLQSAVYLISCAALAAVTSSNTVGLDAMFVGFGIWAFGFAIEVTLIGKTVFRADPDNVTNLPKPGRGPAAP